MSATPNPSVVRGDRIALGDQLGTALAFWERYEPSVLVRFDSGAMLEVLESQLVVIPHGSDDPADPTRWPDCGSDRRAA